MSAAGRPERYARVGDGSENVRICDDRGMEMTLRFEIFPSDLDAAVDFYTRVLRFSVTKDQRHDLSLGFNLDSGYTCI